MYLLQKYVCLEKNATNTRREIALGKKQEKGGKLGVCVLNKSYKGKSQDNCSLETFFGRSSLQYLNTLKRLAAIIMVVDETYET